MLKALAPRHYVMSKCARIVPLLLVFLMAACHPVQKSSPKSTRDTAYYYRPAEQLGELFEAVQLQRVFADGKTFVDSQPLAEPSAILALYLAEKDDPHFDLAAFVHQHFETPDTAKADFELDTSLPMEEHLHRHWHYLTRHADEPQATSTLIALPHDYVVPGGRFREIYYWDSYFTLRGLAASGEYALLEKMLNNFAWLIDEVGHIPNGNRTYYLSRSQPPFFAAMVSLFRELRGDAAAARYLPQLEAEHRFWMAGASEIAPGDQHRRAVRMADGAFLNRYYDDSHSPRPESYREDVRTGHATEPDARSGLYRGIRAAAESGWDFSSRWMAVPGDLTSIQTTAIVPADLNSLLYHLETVISELAAHSGQAAKAREFAERASLRKAAVNRWLWDDESGMFRDFHLERGVHTATQSLATVYPLYFKLASAEQAAAVAEQLQRRFLMPGGLVSTLADTDEQWDYPNGWAPLQWLAIQGLHHYGHHQLSDEIANRWVALNRRVFQTTGRMMEKYNVVDVDLAAGGGEYPLQDGFGWTNGVILAIEANRKAAAVNQ